MYIRFFILLLCSTFSYTIFAKDIESYVKIPCNETNATLCDCAKSLYKALTILEKIQNHNFKLMQQQIRKQAQEGTNTHKRSERHAKRRHFYNHN
ncbi:hypothetical protein [Helicobacter bilis]|uniref:hypothetical protein n=1 Tax=Helicobacter bilis TaxID=37372 RepID=UPI000ABC2ECE|nr:hypothetical protein [Helicobacter bilis]